MLRETVKTREFTVVEDARKEPVADHPGSEIYNDEISLFDLVLILWRNKWAAVATAAAVMALSLAYLLFATPIYKADVHFLPPTHQDIEALNVGRQYVLVGEELRQYDLLSYEVAQVYEQFIRQLNSLALRWEFFRRNNLFDYYAPENEDATEAVVFERAFNQKLIVVSQGRTDDSPFRTISFEMDNAQKTAALLNQFVGFVAGETKAQLIGNVRNSIAAEIDKLETLIESKREVAEQRRQDMIAQLEEALQIAGKLKIRTQSDYTPAQDPARQGDSIVNTAELPLYTRGIHSLQAEIEVLKKRTSNDPYIEGLRDAQERANALRALVIDPQYVRVVTIDSPAVIPVKPEKPDRLLVLAVGACLAVLLGFMAAFFAEFLKGLRQKFKSGSAG